MVWQELEESGWLARSGIALSVTILDASGGLDPLVFRNLTISWHKGLAPQDLMEFDEDAFHLVSALDIIEHLPKDEGYRFLYEMHRISKNLFLRAPNGFVWQPPFATNPFQAHVSSWSPKEFRDMGFELIYGEAGPKALVGIGTLPKFLMSKSAMRRIVRFPERVMIFLGKVLTYRIPSWNAEFVAIKRRRNFDLEAHMIDSGGSTGC